MTRLGPIVLVVFTVGCGDAAVEPRESHPPVESPRSFDPAHAGTIRGTVRWDGELPAVEPVHVLPTTLGLEAFKERKRDNPNAPRIDPQSRGVAGAVVFLKGIDAARARPWNHAAVTVEMRDFGFTVRQ